MEGSWEGDKRKNPYEFANGLPGFERSTSAPPPETDFLFRHQSDGNRKDSADVSYFMRIILRFSEFICCHPGSTSSSLLHLIAHPFDILLSSPSWVTAFSKVPENYIPTPPKCLTSRITITISINNSQHHLALRGISLFHLLLPCRTLH